MAQPEMYSEAATLFSSPYLHHDALVWKRYPHASLGWLSAARVFLLHACQGLMSLEVGHNRYWQLLQSLMQSWLR